MKPDVRRFVVTCKLLPNVPSWSNNNNNNKDIEKTDQCDVVGRPLGVKGQNYKNNFYLNR